MVRHSIAVIPGDGIGGEVVPAAIRVVEAAAARSGIELQWEYFPWGCENTTPSSSAQSECRVYRSPSDIDFVVVRENNEGEYSEIGGRLYEGTDEEMAVQQTVFTRRGVDRALRYAFELATRRRRHVTSATKSNGIIHTMPYWDERFREMAREFPDVQTDEYHIDILTANFVQHPDWFDVVVASNLFGHILSDLGPAIAGSIGIAPSANLNPDGAYPSMFEPVHGSAPDIAGQGIANPIGQIWSAALMMRELGHPRCADAIETAVETVVAEARATTRDLGGSAGTDECADAVTEAVIKELEGSA